MSELSPSSKDIRGIQEQYLDDETFEFMQIVSQKLSQAAEETADMMGKDLDIHLVRSNSTNIGDMPCWRLRFTPKIINFDNDRYGRDSENRRVRQLIVEVPKFFDGTIPSLVFTTTTTEDEVVQHHAISNKRILSVDPRDDGVEILFGEQGRMIIYRTSDMRGIAHYEDLDQQKTDDDEINSKVTLLRMLLEIVNNYNLGNQSRSDGTAA